MTTFQELDAYLNQEFSDDYWYDDAKFYACELVKQLTTDDWDTLKSSWRNRSKQWQVRCAEIIDWGDKHYCVPLLLEMIREGDDELTLTAADSLSSIGVAELDLPVAKGFMKRLQEVAQTGNIAKRIIDELIEQLHEKAAYRLFLKWLLQAAQDSNDDPKVIYPILQENLDKLNDSFAQELRTWTIAVLQKVEPEQVQYIATDIANLSSLIKEFLLGNPATNLEIAITGYEVVATFFNQEAFLPNWAGIQYNLGSGYLYRIRGERAENIEAAIRYYLEALKVFTREAFSQDWANTQNSLGNSFRNRIRGDRAENLEAAIRYYLEALKVFSREASPQDWANTRSNLGNAYLYRIQGDKAENLEVAIRCYSEALQVSNRLEFPQDWATIQNNLGNAYCKRIQGDRLENLEAAIHCYSEALELLTSETYPQDWAGTQSNLGNAYLYRIRGDRAENIEAAIQHYLAALEVSIREAFPQNWAEIQNNLGGAYLERILGERAENLEAAIGCFLGALEIYTRRAFPQNHAETQFNLGLAYQDSRQFTKAYNAFATAIETVEFLRNEIVSGDEVKQKLAQEWNALYQSMVEVCLELHDYAKAIEYVERSQALNIVELLAKPDLYPEGSIPPDISNQLARLRQKITTQPQLIDMAVERRRRGILTWESANAGRTKEPFLVAS